MDDDEKADIARRGIALIDRAGEVSPERLRERAGQAVRGAAEEAVLEGVRKIASLTGSAPKRPRVGPSPEAVEHMLARMEAESTAQFDAELRHAVQKSAQVVDVEAGEAANLDRLRHSFPAESKELAVLLFACVDLLEDLAEIDDPPTHEALAKKERLLARIGALLAPRAETALASFVAHVVGLSQAYRAK
jgi:hypothetical protein